MMYNLEHAVELRLFLRDLFSVHSYPSEPKHKLNI